MTTLTVGSGQQFTTIAAAVAAAQPGDTVQIQAGTYTDDFPGYINGLTVEGVGGQVNLVATQAPPNGKGIFDVGGNTTLQNLSFSGATDDNGNGAGVRYEGGNLTVENCSFDNNQDGILGAPDPNGTIDVDSSEFGFNGTSVGNAHNLYIGNIQQFTITNSSIHDADTGHEIKSRAQNNTITGDTIEDNNSTASYSIDLPDGGNATISNDTIEKGPSSGNNSLIAYGEEGGSGTLTGSPNPGSSLILSGDAFINNYSAHTPQLLWNAGGASVTGSNDTLQGITSSQLGSGVPASLFSNAADTTTPAASAAPAPASTPAPVAGETDTLTVDLSEDAYQGDAQASIAIDGTTLGTPTVTMLHASGNTQAYTFTGDWGPGSHTVAISFLNDAYGGTSATDRNLYVDHVSYDGNGYGAGMLNGAPASTSMPLLCSGDTALFSVHG